MATEQSRGNLGQREKVPHCVVDVASIFVGFTSLPIGLECKFTDKLKRLFEAHKKGVSAQFTTPESKEIFKDFFQPKFYYTFSSFDLAVVSLINDFEFPTQTFHPYHPYWPREPLAYPNMESNRDYDCGNRIDSFYHQVVTGPFPRFSERNDSLAINLSKETFLSKHPLPLIGICQLKINNELLIGTGTDLLRCVIRSVKQRFDEETSSENSTFKNNFQMIMLESTAWSELTILLFSNSYGAIFRFVLELRSMRISELERILKDTEDWECFRELLQKRIIHREEAHSILNIFGDTPIFINSTTTLGFRFELFEGGSQVQEIKPIDEKDKIYAFCRFLTGPAHLGNAINKVVGKSLRECPDTILICAGRGDFVHRLRETGSDLKLEQHSLPMRTIDFVQMVARAFRNQTLQKDVKGVNIIISAAPESLLKEGEELNKLFPELKEGNFDFEERLGRLVVNADRVRQEIYEPMKNCSLPKVVTLRLINAIALYNEGIQDQFLFSNFLELRPFVETLLKTVSSISKRVDSFADTSDYLNSIIDIFEKGWRNRYHGNWRLGELTDFNLEFKGGIQQLVAAIDGAYKALSAVLGKDGAIAIVSGSPRLSSTEMSIELNYFDIFKPEFFAARASHEAACHGLLSSMDYVDLQGLTNPPTMGADRSIAEEVSRLREELSKYKDWFDPLTTPFTSRLFSKVFGDMCAFRYTYMSDPDLFVYWYRNIFIADPEAWKIHEGISSTKNDALMDFLVRMVIVLEDIDDAINVLEEYWLKDKLQGFGVSIKVIEEFHTVIKEVLSNSNLFRKWLVASSRCISDIGSMVGFNLSRAKNYAAEMEANLDHGRICRYDIENWKPNESRFIFVQSLFNAYLSLLKKKSGAGNVLLERDTKGNPVLNPEKDARILFDRRGGTFVPGEEMMGWYFRSRCAFIWSLWDMSTKEKFYIPELRRILEVRENKD